MQPSDRLPQVKRLADVKVRTVRWIDPGRIPIGALTILDGDPGMGKSTVALDYASRVSRGSPMPSGAEGDLFEKPAGVVIMSAEDDASTTIRPKLERMGADLARIYLLDGVRDEDADEDIDPAMATIQDLPAIASTVESTKARLLVIDPLMAYLPSRTNAHKDQHIRAVFSPLIGLARRLRFAILVVRHLNKLSSQPQTVSALYRGGGSIGIAGASRSVLLVACDPTDETRERRIMARVKGNLSKAPKALLFRLQGDGDEPAVVAWEGELQQDPEELVRPPQIDEEPNRIQEACDWLAARLSDGEPQASRDLIKEAKRDGIADRTLHRARIRIGARAKKGHNGGPGWFWILPISESSVEFGDSVSKTVSPQPSKEKRPKLRLVKADHVCWWG